jgi:SAM-dependent methyltransferase
MADDDFTADWLALREPVDHRSRPYGLLRPLRATWHARRWSRILDLGSGTGSNFRYLAPRLPGAQDWTLLDHDPELLARVRAPDPSPPVRRVVGSLADEGLTRVAGTDLVTASAVLDLVSEGWLGELVDRCCASGCGALLALSYDGTQEWSGPADPEDAPIQGAVNAHQRRDKGLGPALGPAAPRVAETFFREAAYHVWVLPSAWRLGPGDRDLARALLEGWCQAAREEVPPEAPRFEAWRERRLRDLEVGKTQLTVGHMDLLALPAPA